MNILLTNDDGINSPGIQKLAETLRSRGKHSVTVVAPDANRSGVSHGISILNTPVKLSNVGEDTWSCSGNPADCVMVVILGALSAKPDLVLSGINQGENLGTDLIFSGTAAAARQASLSGIPAVALSLAGRGHPFYWEMAASWTADHLEELTANWGEDTFVNVNIPNLPGGPEGMALTWPAVKRYRDSLTEITAPNGGRWCFVGLGLGSIVEEAGSDCDAVSRNLVSVSSVCNFAAVRRDLCPGAPDHAALAPRLPRAGRAPGY